MEEIKKILEPNEEILWYKEFFNNFRYSTDLKRYKQGLIITIFFVIFTLALLIIFIT